MLANVSARDAVCQDASGSRDALDEAEALDRSWVTSAGSGM